MPTRWPSGSIIETGSDQYYDVDTAFDFDTQVDGGQPLLTRARVWFNGSDLVLTNDADVDYILGGPAAAESLATTLTVGNTTGPTQIEADFGTPGTPIYTFVTDTDTGIFHPGPANTVALTTGGGERIRFTDTQVLINTAQTGNGQRLRVDGTAETTGVHTFGGGVFMGLIADPTVPNNTGALYTKNVGGDAELYYRSSSDGLITQITLDGAVQAPARSLAETLAVGAITGGADITFSGAGDTIIYTRTNSLTLDALTQATGPGIAQIPDLGGNTYQVVMTGVSQTLTNKTLTTPTIGSFTNATHNHEAAAGGGTLSFSAATTGTVLEGRGGTGETTYAVGDLLYSDAIGSLARRTIGAAGQHLTVQSGLPTWTTVSAGSSGFNSEASATANTTTTSTGDVPLAGMTLTPGAGNYVVFFSTVSYLSGGGAGGQTAFFSIYAGGVKIAASEREREGTNHGATATQAYIAGLGAAEAIEIRWRVTGATGNADERTLTVLNA